jgi:hypothetical protein
VVQQVVELMAVAAVVLVHLEQHLVIPLEVHLQLQLALVALVVLELVLMVSLPFLMQLLLQAVAAVVFSTALRKMVVQVAAVLTT